jgi:hypothetical protein
MGMQNMHTKRTEYEGKGKLKTCKTVKKSETRARKQNKKVTEHYIEFKKKQNEVIQHATPFNSFDHSERSAFSGTPSCTASEVSSAISPAISSEFSSELSSELSFESVCSSCCRCSGDSVSATFDTRSPRPPLCVVRVEMLVCLGEGTSSGPREGGRGGSCGDEATTKESKVPSGLDCNAGDAVVDERAAGASACQAE